MYEQHYNFKLPPFECSADPRFFFASEQHHEALAAIEYTIRMRKGIVLITGEVGSGKTTVGRMMCQRCERLMDLVRVSHGHRSRKGLLRQVLRGLDTETPAEDDHASLVERLHDRLAEQAHGARPVVLFVDEGQTLADEALEELRLMSNIDTDSGRALQIVLVGQPELRHRIRAAEHTALRQRIVMAKHLRPLTPDETDLYIKHRLRTASIDVSSVQARFDADAVQEIFRASRGIPRVVNVICDNSLLLGSVQGVYTITRDMAAHVLHDMVPRFDEPAIVTANLSDKLTLSGAH